VPSIVTAPAAPGISPNFTAHIYVQDRYFVPAGTTYYSNNLGAMYDRHDKQPNGTTLWPGMAPFINNGILWDRCSNGYDSRVIFAWNFDHITNEGLIVAEALVGQAITIEVRSAFEGLTNNGGIYALSSQWSALAILISGFGPIVNNGVIAALRSGPGDPPYAANTITRFSNGRIVNNETGSILAEGSSARAIWIDRGHILAPGHFEQPDIENAGRIEAVATDAQNQSVAIKFVSLDHERANILNSGTIRADIAIDMYAYEPGPVIQARKLITNLAGGVIDGAVLMSRFDEIILNYGLIDGAVAMFDGDDLIVNAAWMAGAVDLGSGNDLYLGQATSAPVSVSGNAGTDVLIGGSGADAIDGGDGDDWIQGGGGADILTGGAGADRFVIAGPGDSTAAAADTIKGFVSGLDRIDLSAVSPTSLDLSASGGMTTLTAQSALGTVVIRIEGTVTAADILQAPAGTVLSGTANGDALHAGGAVHELHGGGGKDLLVGSDGDDLLDGGAGADLMSGGAGNDVYIVDHGLFATSGIDTDADHVLELDGEGIDEVRTAIKYELPDAVENLVFLGAGGIRVEGNRLDNVMTGNDSNNIMAARDGNDILIGGGGSDTLDGGLGADRIVYRAAGDSTAAAFDIVWEFESRIDKIDVTALAVESIGWTKQTENTGVSINTYFMATIVTGEGTMTIRLNTAELRMSDFLVHRDFAGTSGNDILQGTAFTDSMDGTAGNDTIRGGNGNDSLAGGGGDDWLQGDAGIDQLTGGSGADVFAFLTTADSTGHALSSEGKKSRPDLIVDFTSGVDKISLEGIDAIEGGASNDAFTFIGTGAFTRQAGEVRYEIVDGRANIFADTNGDGYADIQIAALTTTIAASDFIL
jgi:Ca2+-binding RTX toxin-like protein